MGTIITIRMKIMAEIRWKNHVGACSWHDRCVLNIIVMCSRGVGGGGGDGCAAGVHCASKSEGKNYEA